jgi:hypothetical protein
MLNHCADSSSILMLEHLGARNHHKQQHPCRQKVVNTA